MDIIQHVLQAFLQVAEKVLDVLEGEATFPSF